jgi:hypothetical protein
MKPCASWAPMLFLVCAFTTRGDGLHGCVCLSARSCPLVIPTDGCITWDGQVLTHLDMWCVEPSNTVQAPVIGACWPSHVAGHHCDDDMPLAGQSWRQHGAVTIPGTDMSQQHATVMSWA